MDATTIGKNTVCTLEQLIEGLEFELDTCEFTDEVRSAKETVLNGHQVQFIQLLEETLESRIKQGKEIRAELKAQKRAERSVKIQKNLQKPTTQ